MTRIPDSRPSPDWLALSEAAKLLRVSKERINTLRTSRRVEVMYADGIWWYHRPSLEAYARARAALQAAKRAYAVATRMAS